MVRHTSRGEAKKAGLHCKEDLRRKADIPVSDNQKVNMFLGSGVAVHYCQNMRQLEVTNVNDDHTP